MSGSPFRAYVLGSQITQSAGSDCRYNRRLVSDTMLPAFSDLMAAEHVSDAMRGLVALRLEKMRLSPDHTFECREDFALDLLGAMLFLVRAGLSLLCTSLVPRIARGIGLAGAPRWLSSSSQSAPLGLISAADARSALPVQHVTCQSQFVLPSILRYQESGAGYPRNIRHSNTTTISEASDT